MSNKVVFLDRDGVINIDYGYVHKKSDFIFNDEIFSTLRYLKSRGFVFIIITNQSGIGRGYFSENDFKDLNIWMIDIFSSNGIDILETFFCPHSPAESCDCRKPNPGLIEKAIKKYSIDRDKSWMIGDSERDIEAAHNANIDNTILLGNKLSSKEKTKAKFRIDSIQEIRQLIL